MSFEFVRDLLVHGIASAKANEKEEARRLLTRALNLATDFQQRIEILFWLSEVSEEPKEQRDYLETILAMDMSDGRARRKLAVLDGKISPQEIIDPDQFHPPVPTEPQAISMQRFTCPNCGGRMVFQPDGQALVCEYCKSSARSSGGDVQIKEEDFFLTMATKKGHDHMMATRIFLCQGCNASFILSPTQLSIVCPYCDSPHVVLFQEKKEIVAPTGIIPFSISERQARILLKSWLTKHANLSDVKVKPGHGLYIPAWTFDVAGAVPWQYRIRDQGKRKPTIISGEYFILRNDIMVLATKSIHEISQEQISQYHLDLIRPFKEAYLASWPAETYHIPVAEASLIAREKAFSEARANIKQEIPGGVEELRITSEKIRIDSYKLILLPIWLTTYIHQQRQYAVSINGQSGYVIGDIPPQGTRKWIRDLFGSE